MKNIVDKLKIIGLKEHGFSNRNVAKMESCNRKTVAKYWNEYLKQKAELFTKKDDYKELQEKITEPPKYNSDNRIRRKFTTEIADRLNEILEEEKLKDKILGTHKQQLTKKQIHEMLVAEGFDINTMYTSNRQKKCELYLYGRNFS